jgi:hypothetical protein
MEQGPGDAGRRSGSPPRWQQHGGGPMGCQRRREGKGRGDATRLWTRERLRRVTAPEGRAREREWSGRPHRLRAAGPWHCDAWTTVGTTRGLRPRTSSVRRQRPSGRGWRARPDSAPPATGRADRVTRAASGQGDLAAAHLVSQRTAHLDGASAQPGCKFQPRPVAARCSLFRHSSNGGPPGSPARRQRCFGTDVVETLAGPAPVLGLGASRARRRPHGTSMPQGVPGPRDGVESGPSCCLQPGEPHGRLQGATDLHRVCGASRRSREKRQGRNVSRSGKPGPKARNEAEANEKAQAGPRACPVRWTPCLAGTAASPERTHTLDVDGEAIFETNPMRGVRSGSSRPERGS